MHKPCSLLGNGECTVSESPAIVVSLHRWCVNSLVKLLQPCPLVKIQYPQVGHAEDRFYCRQIWASAIPAQALRTVRAKTLEMVGGVGCPRPEAACILSSCSLSGACLGLVLIMWPFHNLPCTGHPRPVETPGPDAQHLLFWSWASV